jgi:hypothetical protein
MAIVIRTTLVKFNNDATACFDRILVHLLNLRLRSFGMPKKLTTILGELLRVARYALKTGIGISKKNVSSYGQITSLWIRTGQCSIGTRMGQNSISTIQHTRQV